MITSPLGICMGQGLGAAVSARVRSILLRLRWRVAGGAKTTWVFGTDAQVVKDCVGLNHADIPMVAAGLHDFRLEGTGAVTAAEESAFNVVTSFGGAA